MIILENDSSLNGIQDLGGEQIIFAGILYKLRVNFEKTSMQLVIAGLTGFEESNISFSHCSIFL